LNSLRDSGKPTLHSRKTQRPPNKQLQNDRKSLIVNKGSGIPEGINFRASGVLGPPGVLLKFGFQGASEILHFPQAVGPCTTL
jgi:hypothetical protein